MFCDQKACGQENFGWPTASVDVVDLAVPLLITGPSLTGQVTSRSNADQLVVIVVPNDQIQKSDSS
ncbi:MAG: hypothetical protein DSY87_09745 [Methylococcus sp.]|nr:MAG: hypothetical protein DSY87_09745 [Methylococcus sp.]